MLKRRIRNATAAARPVKASGVAEMSVFVNAPSATNAASKSRLNVGSGACPVTSSTTAIARNATISEPIGTATGSQRRWTSRRSIRTEGRVTRRPP